MENSDTLGILKRLERGEISASEADARLRAPQVEPDDLPPFQPTGAPQWVRRLWVYPLVAGILVVGAGAWIVAATANVNALWFLCGLPILLLGAFVLAFAAGMRSGHWLYVNIQSSRRRRGTIRFGIPFPFGLIRFAMRVAKHTVKHPRTRIRVGTAESKFNVMWDDSDALFAALERELAEGRGVTVDVEDNDARVQVYIV
jgi:hypothetical protein